MCGYWRLYDVIYVIWPKKKTKRQGFPSPKLKMTPQKSQFEGKAIFQPPSSRVVGPSTVQTKDRTPLLQACPGTSNSIISLTFLAVVRPKKTAFTTQLKPRCGCLHRGNYGKMMVHQFTSGWTGAHCFQTNRDKPKQSCSDTALHCMDIGLLIWLGVETPCGSGAWHPTLRVIAWNSTPFRTPLIGLYPLLFGIHGLSPFFQRLSQWVSSSIWENPTYHDIATLMFAYP